MKRIVFGFLMLNLICLTAQANSLTKQEIEEKGYNYDYYIGTGIFLDNKEVKNYDKPILPDIFDENNHILPFVIKKKEYCISLTDMQFYNNSVMYNRIEPKLVKTGKKAKIKDKTLKNEVECEVYTIQDGYYSYYDCEDKKEKKTIDKNILHTLNLITYEDLLGMSENSYDAMALYYQSVNVFFTTKNCSIYDLDIPNRMKTVSNAYLQEAFKRRERVVKELNNKKYKDIKNIQERIKLETYLSKLQEFSL